MLSLEEVAFDIALVNMGWQAGHFESHNGDLRIIFHSYQLVHLILRHFEIL